MRPQDRRGLFLNTFKSLTSLRSDPTDWSRKLNVFNSEEPSWKAPPI